MDELREMLDEHAMYYQEELYNEILSWHKAERKKWALEKVLKAIINYEDKHKDIISGHYSNIIGEIRKKIEER